MSVDTSGSNLYQQQGTRCCHLSRVDQAQKWMNEGGVASADALIEIGRKYLEEQSAKEISTKQPDGIRTGRNDHSEPQSQVIAKLKALLEHIDPDCGYKDWLHVLMAIFQETGGSEEGLKLAIEWSSKGKKYKGSSEIKAKWRSFRLDVNNPITIATLKKLVSDSGKDLSAICSTAEPGFKKLDFETQVIKPLTSSKDQARGSGNIKQSPETKVNSRRENQQSLDPLEYLQKNYALIKIGGKLWLLDIASLKSHLTNSCTEGLKLYNWNDGGWLLMRTLKANYPQADTTTIKKEFFVSPQTTCYEGVEFNPAGTSKNTLNLWIGPTITPRQGEWKLIQAYLFEVICDSDQVAYDYLLKFIAHALQKPWEKPGILVILIGGQGTGKGTLANILRRIWEATYLQIHNIDAVTGNFNGVLERNFIIFMDEALFVGDRRASDSLKSLVTEPVIYINEKHQPARQTLSFHRFFAATNADHFKNTDRDDRRDFVLRVSDVHKGNHAYWQALYSEIENGGVEAMVYDLLAMDLSKFNVREKPQTKELLEQKLQSLSLIPRWWYNCLVDGEIDFGDDASWPDFISTQTIISLSIELSGKRVHRKPDAKDVANEMKKLCPSACRKQQQEGYSRARGYSLPPLVQARAEFERYIGGKIDW
ncbi:Primase C terminal 2 (PriCT-2) [Nitrosomonas nitrosa]|uniref:Primase C terminal 2 (PriCT-2) n=1 Tax=Nitrosomonas nitrosa TaxID=52442 RepID=A0A1I4TNX3_9PROT|nr:DUF5906 domain-containing protein [Nitrosomonas nitrosa]SFM78280.1 Primase C terminal 2 (PriCT-2) [Nitrosomonas nitrosa]